MSFLNKLKPKKVMECPSCKKRFQFPVKPGKTLSVKCPRCGASYRVSFVNPVVELLKGRLKWSALSQSEKNKLLVVGLVIIMMNLMRVYYN